MPLMILISLEVLAINLIVTFFCAKGKYPVWINILVLGGTTALLLAISFLFIEPGNGPSIWGIILGFVFIVPLYVLLDIKIYKLVYIMTLTWLYSLVVSGTSQLLGTLWFPHHVTSSALVLQTLLFLVTIVFMIRFVKDKVLFLLTTMQRNWGTLLSFSASMFFSAVVIRHFSSFDTVYLQILVMWILLLGSYLFHQVFFLLFQNRMSLLQAHERATTDTLTGTGNRYALFQTIESLIQQGTPFELIFLDLDRFKRVNDDFSHMVGDQYLQHFASVVTECQQPGGTLYRFAGDEFICVRPNPMATFDKDAFLSHVTKRMNDRFTFYGVSLGTCRFPEDATTADGLVEIADKRMYVDKGYRDTKHLRPKTRTS